MKRKSLILAALALVLVLCVSIGPAWAYFTTYAPAQGGYVIKIGDDTTILEEYENWVKSITITSDADSEPVWVRAQAFGGSTYPLNVHGENWTGPDDDGWFYYANILNGGESTQDPLIIEINDVPVDEADGAEAGDNFNVVVVYESTPVQYDANGDPFADWSISLDKVTTPEELSQVKGGEG